MNYYSTSDGLLAFPLIGVLILSIMLINYTDAKIRRNRDIKRTQELERLYRESELSSAETDLKSIDEYI